MTSPMRKRLKRHKMEFAVPGTLLRVTEDPVYLAVVGRSGLDSQMECPSGSALMVVRWGNAHFCCLSLTHARTGWVHVAILAARTVQA